MHFDWNVPAEDFTSVRDWLTAFEPSVQSVDFLPAKSHFAENIASFGTHADVVEGIDALEATQWRAVWPAIEDFRFLYPAMKVGVSADRLFAVLIVPWDSTGIGEDGGRFPRPGRATVVLNRSTVDAPWLGIHTHFSLNPGTPARSHGDRPARS